MYAIKSTIFLKSIMLLKERINCIFGDEAGGTITVPLHCVRNETGLRIFPYHK